MCCGCCGRAEGTSLERKRGSEDNTGGLSETLNMSGCCGSRGHPARPEDAELLCGWQPSVWHWPWGQRLGRFSGRREEA